MKVIFDNGHGLRVERNENGLLYVGALADLVHALSEQVETDRRNADMRECLIESLRAENEQLKSEIMLVTTPHESVGAIMQKKDAEIERMKKDNENLRLLITCFYNYTIAPPIRIIREKMKVLNKSDLLELHDQIITPQAGGER